MSGGESIAVPVHSGTTATGNLASIAFELHSMQAATSFSLGEGAAAAANDLDTSDDRPNPNTVITFPDTSAHVFLTGGSDELHFSRMSGVNVNIGVVSWYVDSGNGGQQKIIATSVSGSGGMLWLSTDSAGSGQQVVNLKLSDFASSSSSSLGLAMYVHLNWTLDDAAAGYTTSPAFSVVRDGADMTSAQEAIKNSSFAQSKGHYYLSGGGASENSTSGLEPPSTSSQSTSSTSSSSPTSTGSNRSSSSSSSSSSTNGTASIGAHHKAGPSTGAIVGIAVGLIVAALLAAALAAFFFLRRRRRRRASRSSIAAAAAAAAASGKADAASAAEQETLSSFMAAKGGAAAANASDPAIAPYRDDHDQYQTAAAAAAAAGGARGVDPAPLEQQPIASRRPESGSRASMVHGVSRHLVEDGMTEDDIRRLEEEERHLDDEIQRAGERRL